MPAAVNEVDGQRCAPCSGAKDGDPAHDLSLPKRYSVPCKSREMFWWCLTITSRGTKTVTAIKSGVSWPRASSNAAVGKTIAETIEASETYRQIRKTIRNTPR